MMVGRERMLYMGTHCWLMGSGNLFIVSVQKNRRCSDLQLLAGMCACAYVHACVCVLILRLVTLSIRGETPFTLPKLTARPAELPWWLSQ